MAVSMAMSFTHRFVMLVPLSSWGASLKPSTLTRAKLQADFCGIIICAIGGTLAMFCFKTAKETKKIILEVDPTAVVPDSAQTFEYGLVTQIFAFTNAAYAVFSIPFITFIVVHSNRILKRAATSERTKAMHKEAIRSLVIQVMAMLAVALIPVFIFGVCLMWNTVGKLPSYMLILSVFGAGLFSMESFFGSIAILTSIRVYRYSNFRATPNFPSKNATKESDIDVLDTMQALIIFYYVNVSITTILVGLAAYVIIHASTIEMGKFKWLLLFISMSMYLLTVFFTIFFAPVIPIQTVPYVYSTGILWTIFKVPVNIQWGIMTFIMGIAAASINISFNNRYAMLLPLSSWGASRNPAVVARMKLYRDCSSILGGIIGGSLAMFCFKTAEETKEIILVMDPTAVVPESAQTFEYSLVTKIWAFLNFAYTVYCVPYITFIVVHSNRILKKATTSERAKTMHKETIRSLVIQIMSMLSVLLIPLFIFGFCLTWNMVDTLPSYVIVLSEFGCGLFSMESFFGSIAVLTTIKVYRVYLIRKIFYWKPQERRVVSVVSGSSVPN